MSDDEIDWRLRRSEMLLAIKGLHDEDYQESIWKLGFLYALHFQDDEEPNFHDVLTLLEDEGPALMLVTVHRVLDMWRELQVGKAETIQMILDRLPEDARPDRTALMAAKKELKADVQLKAPPVDISRERLMAHERLIWRLTQTTDALRFGDLQMALLKRKTRANMAMN